MSNESGLGESGDLGESGRRAELAEGLARVEERVVAACVAADRPRQDVSLIVVTKTYPASDVRLLADLGVRQVGESRAQEAAEKAQACADLNLSWHFIGRLQSNKARSVGSYADAVHSVDRASVLAPLAAGADQSGRQVGVLVQVSLDGDPARGGVPLDGVLALAAAVAAHPTLTLRGVMAVPPLGEDPAPAFARLAQAADGVRREHPAATWLSAGMSGDLEAAVAAGATHLRVGSAILGSRPSLR